MKELFPRTKVYGGLSISGAEVYRELPFAEFSKPIERWDILKDVDRDYRIIVIVDGQFHKKMAVNPGEILDALRCGVKVYGSSSMGALRAVELSQYGMIGYGKVYEYIKNSLCFRDDFIAQSFSEDTGEAISYTYMDFSFSLDRAVHEETCSPEIAEELRQIYAGIYFAQRTYEALAFEVRRKGTNHEALLGVASTIFKRRFSQKHEDAIGLLNKIREDLVEIAATNSKLWSIQRTSRSDQDVEGTVL